MTSGNVNNFVSDLVLMAKAMEELPHVQQALTASEAEANRLAASVQAREESILRLKTEIEALQAKVRSTEVERDDAELRFLELDEKAHKVLSWLGNFQSEVKMAQDELTPPAPEPMPAPPAEPEAKYAALYEQDSAYASQGQSEPHPIATAATQEPNAMTSDSTTGVNAPTGSTEHSSEVPKSDANPIATSATEHGQQDAKQTHDGDVQPITLDNVGYSNEPDVRTDWQAWDAWCTRMNQRYGVNQWPTRPVAF